MVIDLKSELVKFSFGLVSTAMGVLIALLINSYVEHKKDEETYLSMLRAISNEAAANKQILNESFKANYKLGIVRREFSTKTCEEFISNKIFLDHSNAKSDSLLIQYTLNLKRANNFRIADEKYKYDNVLYDKWGKDLTSAFTKVLNNCDVLINLVTELPKKEKTLH